MSTQVSIGNLLTIIVTGVATIAPLVLPFIPPPYNIAVSGVLASLGALYHLFATPPAPTTVK